MKKMNVFKRTITILLALVIMIMIIPFSALPVKAAWNGSAAYSFASGSGTSYSPYIIETAEQLAYFANTVNSGTTYSGKYIELANNIVLNDESFTFEPDTGLVKVADGTNTAYLGTGVVGDTSGENTVFDVDASIAGTWYSSNMSTETTTYSGKIYKWNLIGGSAYGSTNVFQGNFDGKGYTIEGLYINSSSSQRNSAFFAQLKNATVSNLGVTNSYVYGGDTTAAIVADSINSTIQNCYNSGIIIGISSYYSQVPVGGVVGDLCNGSVANCHNNGVVISSEADGAKSNYVGGVVGLARTSSQTVSIGNCYNAGAVYGASRVGGVIGYLSAYQYSAYANACYNTGTVNGGSEVGGVVGYSHGSDATATIKYCYSTGTVNGSSMVGGVGGGIGGQCSTGRTIVTAVISNCYSDGSVNGESYVGGVFGYVTGLNSKFEKNHNIGRVNGTSHVGGVVGYIFIDIVNCYNAGMVMGTSKVGGVAGCNRESVMSNCYNTAMIYGDSSSVGVILGYNEYNYGTVTNCYSLYGSVMVDGSIIYGTSFETQLSFDEMKDASSYTGFDFSSVWEINAVCGYRYPTLRSSISPKKAHEFDNDCDSTCNACSYVRTPLHTAIGSYKYDEENHWRECSCGMQQNITTHTWNVRYSSTNHWEACLCGIQRNKASHIWDDGVITTAPTHVKEGIRTFSCACGYKRTETVEKLTDHEWNDGVITTEPTCTTEGVMTYTCPCGETYTETVPILEHYVNVYTTMEPEIELENSSTYPFSLSGGRYTSTNKTDSSSSTFTITALRDCSVTIKYGVSSESNYDWLTIYKNNNRLDRISGTVSNKTLTIELLSGEYINITYSKDGSVNNGSDSGYFEIVSGHTEEYITVERVPAASQTATCANPIICDGCGFVVKPALEHEWDDGAVIVEPTDTTDGEMLYNCACGATKTEKIEKLGAKWMQSVSVTITDDLSYNVYAVLPDNATDVYMTFTFDGGVATVQGEQANDGRIKYTFEGILPQQMGMTVTATLKATVNGKIRIETYSGSIESYAKQILNNDSLAEWHGLVQAMLHYGAAAQAVAGQIDGYVNEGVDETPVDRTAIEALYENGDTNIWCSASLVLDNTITMKIGVNAPVGVNYVIYTLGENTFKTAITDGYAYIPVKAGEMMSEIALQLYNGTSVTDDAKLRVSASYYLTVATSDDPNMDALFDAAARYAVYASLIPD